MQNNIPQLGIGTWALAGDYWGEQKHSDSLKTIHAAIREGFKLFDTSPDYGKGKSEQLLGQQIPPNRSDILISTKCFPKPIQSIEKSIENSLKRLNRDYFDYFFIHWPSTKINCNQVMELLETFRSRGIIKNIGVSNFNLSELKNIQNYGDVNIIQNAYNLFWTEDEEYLSYCKDNKITTQCYSPLAQGLLTGKFSTETPYKPKDSRYKMTLFNDKNLQIIYRYIPQIQTIAESESKSMTKLIIQWTLSKCFIDSVIVGCRTRNQIEQLIDINEIPLSKEAILKLNSISKEISKELHKGNNIFNHSY